MTEEFYVKVNTIGDIKTPSYWVCIPKMLAKKHNVQRGSIIKLSFLGFGKAEDYKSFSSFESTTQLNRVKIELNKAKRYSLFPTIWYDKILSEATYLIAVLSKKVKQHLWVKSVIAACLYIVATNHGQTHYAESSERITQEKIAHTFGITSVTIRNVIRKAWILNHNTGRYSRKKVFLTK